MTLLSQQHEQQEPEGASVPATGKQQLQPRKKRLAAALVGVWLLLVGAAAIVLSRSHHDTPTYHPRSAVAATVDQIAVNAAAAWGDTDVSSVSWVASTRSQAVDTLMTGSQVDGTKSVYALEMQGTFHPGAGISQGVLPGPSGEPSTTETGNVLLVIVTTSDLIVTDIGMQNDWVPLTTLGTPETDPLSGLSPTRSTP